jgi:hypothetical protein
LWENLFVTEKPPARHGFAHFEQIFVQSAQVVSSQSVEKSFRGGEGPPAVIRRWSRPGGGGNPQPSEHVLQR